MISHSLMEMESSLLERAETLLRQAIAPQAEQIDTDPVALQSALQTLADASLLALRVPSRWGGLGVDDKTFYLFQELVARYSGALAFLQAQHQSAGAMLSHSDNESLQQRYLPQMSNGKALLGIGFAHLRRPVPPLKALPVTGGYQLEGQVPWVTGFGFFQAFIVAAVLPDGKSVYGVVPLQSTHQEASGSLLCREPMPLAAMISTNTVSVEFHKWFLPTTQVVSVKPAGAIQKSDQLNVLSSSFFALGNARSSLDIVERVLQEKSLPFLQSTYSALQQELLQCHSAILTALVATTFTEKLRLRARAIALAGRCAHAAVTVSSGAANLLSCPAQRVYREVLMFTVSGQTTAVMEATLAELIREPD